MSVFLVHIHTGPTDPTKVTLGCAVALAAAKAGHDVRLFFAGDGVHNLSADNRASVVGVGTGKLADHLAGLVEAGAQFTLSGGSAKARGYGDELLDDLPGAEFGAPPDLVGYADAADTVLCY